jgi:prepilin-type N-terminal cleavage/methylation domain-containing protein
MRPLTAAVGRFRAVRTDRAGGERGLTLIELLVVIAILSVIAVPLGDALINYLRHENDTTDRLSVSRDSQIAAAFFAQDVASMGRRDWTNSPFPPLQSLYTVTSSAFQCTTSGGNLVVGMVSDLPQQNGSSGLLRSVSYVLVPGTNGLQELHRVSCSGTATQTSDIVVASDVVSVSLTCPGAICGGSTTPQTVQLVLHLRAPSDSNDFLDVTLYGQRRQT